ncbi:hypothetical protein [Pseudanabaena sp. FACHB-2040]|uniref:hypothetical protein n=1 Tax=Pseudanabaena sp. FACHB-2040 TaxID=2692859 RepID=UPI001683AD1E|nr:hypothetical protein [Pseudanabaena sp. FACHB-2040]MBD2259652.1 hypothetical protein [Pseudanabaena sp. FACHB-2040]
MNQRQPSPIPWFPLAFPVSFVSISASISPNTLLGDLGELERYAALFILALLATGIIAGALIDELTS